MTKKELVIQYVKEKISSEKWKPGYRLPGENDLGVYLNVSRLTVRNALEELLKENIIEKKKGSGSYVKNNHVNDKYIMLVLADRFIDSPSISISKIMEILKQLISNAGYIPYFYLENYKKPINEVISINTDDIAGIIYAEYNKYRIFSNKNIPIVNLYSSVGYSMPVVTFNYLKFYQILEKLIRKYEFKKIIFFTFNSKTFYYHNTWLTRYAFKKYIEEKYNATIVDIPFEASAKKISDSFCKILNKLTDIPDVIIFSDDTIYKACSLVFHKYDPILSRTKIITQTNNNDFYNKIYPICEINFNLNEVAKKTFKLLRKLIKKDFIEDWQILVDPTIINEDALK